MNTPQLENGFIQIATGNEANDILLALIKNNLNATEYKIILLIIRKTWGFKKKEDWISLTQFENLTNKTRSSVCSAIKILVKKNILVKKSIPGVRAYYQLNKHFNEWKQLVKKTALVQKTGLTSAENRTQLVQKTAPTKETITKETITKERGRESTHIKIRKHKITEKDISLEDIKDFKIKFPNHDIDNEFNKMKDWLLYTGKEQIDYKAFFRNWLRRAEPSRNEVIKV